MSDFAARPLWFKCDGNFQCTCGNYFYVRADPYACLCGRIYRLRLRLECEDVAPRWSDAELVARTVAKEAGRDG